MGKAELLAEVNGHIAELIARSWPTAPGEFFCECGRWDCTETVRLPLPAYEALRRRGGPVLAPHRPRAKSRSWPQRPAASGRPAAST